MQRIDLQDYSIFLGFIWEAWNQFLKEFSYSKVIVLVDQNTAQHCFPILKAYTKSVPLQCIQIASGEQNKNIRTCQQIWSDLMQMDIDRNALLVNLGGGVIGDMGGFCASTYKRGIDFVQFPTTLLAQVDASIGGKLGIDFGEVKNSIGLFRNPKAVFLFPEFFNTLPKRERRSGFAEIIKHSLIADEIQWKKITAIPNLDAVHWADYLHDSLMVKKQIVAIDPFEKGLRKALNFGHTIGHAMESYFLKTSSPLLHGEAIAIGMICEAYLSHRLSGLSIDELEEIQTFILQIFDCQPIPMKELPFLLNIMRKDKKNENSKINFSLLTKIGAVQVNQVAEGKLIEESIQYYDLRCGE